MALKLYNTLTKTKEEFDPIDKDHVRMYVCGPTVYDFAHIGNARPVIVFDVLFRLLRHVYGEGAVTYVRNITDVDDKINARAARDYPGVDPVAAIRDLTEKTYQQFERDVTDLGCLKLAKEDTPRATEHIAGMIALIEALIARGHAYAAEGHVLFDVPSMPAYGELARRSLDDMIAGARVDVAPYKRDAMDFVLWKPSSEDEPGWDSPWGRGRPGWHIECSAMSFDTLITPFGGGFACDDPERQNVFDIHGGGIDLVFPHHENEIAQSCCALGTRRMANVWMHNGFLQVEGEKMSKSLGNFLTIRELLDKWPGDVLRYNMLKSHYRQPIDWTEKGLNEAKSVLQKWANIRKIASGSKEDQQDWQRLANLRVEPQPTQGFIEHLCNDLNTPGALADLHSLVRDAESGSKQAAFDLISNVYFMGFTLDDFIAEKDVDAVQAAIINALIADRLAARKAKNFAESDRLRDELLAFGVTIKDGKDPATGEPVTTWEVKL